VGRAHVLVSNALLARMQDPDGHIARRLTVIQSSPFCDETHLALISSPILADGYWGSMDVVLEDDETIWFKKDCDV
jgi:hypothetical protein